VLEPGLRIYKIYNGYWFFGRPTVEELRLDLRRAAAAVPIGTSATKPANSLGKRREGEFLPVERRTRRSSPNRNDDD
jgi:hypothetical protein